MKSKYIISTALAFAVISGASIPVTTHAWSMGNLFKGDISSGDENSLQERSQFDGQHAQKNTKSVKGKTQANKQTEQKGNRKNNAQKPVMSAEMQALMTELQTAQKAKDTTAIEAVKAKIKTLQESERAVKDTAMNTAIAGGYDTWKAYVTAQEPNSPILQKITSSNFSLYVQYLAAQKQMRDLGAQLNMNSEMPR